MPKEFLRLENLLKKHFFGEIIISLLIRSTIENEFFNGRKRLKS